MFCDLKSLYSRMTLPVAGALVGAAILAAGVARAEEKKSGANRVAPEAEQKSPASPAADAVAQLGLAHSLAQYGHSKKSPLALLAAAEILQRTPTSELTEKPKSEPGPSPSSPTPEKKAKPATTADSLVKEARELGAGDPQIESLADKLAQRGEETSRGAVGGAKRNVTKAALLSTDSYTINFRGGEVAAVAVSGDGDTDLDLYVYDENGNLVAADDDNSDDCLVRFIPKWSGPFIVRVKNRGLVYNSYVIATN